MAVEVVVRFEAEEKVSNQALDNLRRWVDGTMDNAPYDEEFGFPEDEVESCAMVVGIRNVD
jgi:hypothetical protein